MTDITVKKKYPVVFAQYIDMKYDIKSKSGVYISQCYVSVLLSSVAVQKLF